MAEPDFVLVRSKETGNRFVIDRINLNDTVEEIGVPELLAAGPSLPKPHVSLTRASAAKAASQTGDTGTKKEG
jgi:hypothetical protein